MAYHKSAKTRIRRNARRADISRARELLEYEPSVFLEEGLEATMAWCRTQTFAPKPV